MAVYDGVPSIRLEGDKDRALALIPEAKALLYRVQEFLRIADITTFSSSQRVGEDGYIYVLCSHGQNIIHISVDVVEVAVREEEVPTPPEGKAPFSFYSGLVFRGHLEQRTSQGQTYSVCATFAPTPVCVEINSELSSGRQSAPRLAVQPFFDELQNQGSGPQYSQYTMLRPSMYSGTMATVVQLVMGLGRLSKNAFRNTQNQTLAPEYARRVERNGVQVCFDYKFHRTHGITIGPDGTRWLVEISQARGVIAMRLPVFPGSYSAGYRDAADARGDTPTVTALDALGCLPTGETFPLDVSAAIASGDVLQLMPAAALEPFYAHMPYSINMGWAFNSRGSEAHNTGYRFADDNVQRGVWYQISINIGALVENRGPNQPIAVGSASLRLQSEGYLFATRTPIGRYLPIKFYDPLLPGLRSHDGAPSLSTTINPRCDTAMFVCFVEDELKVVKFFRNPQIAATNTIDDPRYPGECMYAGEWVITETSGDRSFPTMMYTNDLDDRQAVDPYVSITTIVSTDLGFDPPRFADIITALDWAHVTRRKAFRRVTTVDTRQGETAGAVVVIPQFCRELYYYATGASYTVGRSGSTSIAYDYLTDPNTGWSWRNFPAAAGSNPSGLAICGFDNCGGRRGRNGPHAQRKVVCTTREEGACSDFADSGTWLTMCEAVDSFNSVPYQNRVPRQTFWNLGEDARASMKVVGRGYNGMLALPLTISSFRNRWSVPSPDPETFIIQQMYATYSTLGQDCLVYETDLSGGEVAHNGYIPEPIGSTIPCFIGANHP